MSRIECPYCDYENDMTNYLCELPHDNIFDAQCSNCEEEFEVFVEFDPILSASKIEVIDCENCGEEMRDFHQNEKTFPFPKSMGNKKICHKCFLKFMGKEELDVQKN